MASSKQPIPKWIIYAIMIAVVASWLPFAITYKARSVRSARPPVHIFQDMDAQPKLKTQGRQTLFADNRAMRPEIPGTVARGQLHEDEHYYTGRVNGEWATEFPDELIINRQFVERGRERYNIFCATCHGLTGAGNGPTHQRAIKLETMGWVQPTSLLSESVRERSPGHLFNTITHGIRNMPAYAPQIPVEDRWAIVAYIQALQLSRDAELEAVPADKRDTLR